MKKLFPGSLGALLLAGAAAFLTLPLAAQTAPQATKQADRWLHVSVVSTNAEGETVRINVPLSLAEKVLPTLHANKLRGGRVRMDDLEVSGVDLRALLEVLRDAPDNEFVTVESKDETVRVAKEKGYLIVKVDERTGSQDQVDVKIPFTVVEALLSGDKLDQRMLCCWFFWLFPAPNLTVLHGSRQVLFPSCSQLFGVNHSIETKFSCTHWQFFVQPSLASPSRRLPGVIRSAFGGYRSRS